MEKQYAPKKEKQMPKAKHQVTAQVTEAAASAVEKKKPEIIEQKKEEVKVENSETKEKKGEDKKVEKKVEVKKKSEAVVNGNDLPISKKHSMAICDFIRGKEIEKMITELAKVVSMKMPIKMRGEIPHRRNIGPGRYPINASKAFINLLKSLKANIEVNQIDNPYIAVAVANDASRPFKKGGMRFKRTNVLLIAREKAKKEAKAEKKEENKKVKEKK